MKSTDTCPYKWKIPEPKVMYKEMTWGACHMRVKNQRDNYKPSDVNSC